MRRSSSRLASGRRRTPRTTLKMAALAPMPRASVRMTVMVSPLVRERERTANFRSCQKVIGIPHRIRHVHYAHGPTNFPFIDDGERFRIGARAGFRATHVHLFRRQAGDAEDAVPRSYDRDFQ